MKALSLASSNLHLHSRSICENFDTYYSHAQKEFSKQSLLLTSFPNDLETLKQIPIHPSILSDKKEKYLVSFVPIDKIIAWVDRCRLVYEQLMSKTYQVSTSIQAIRNEIEKSNSQSIGVDVLKLESMMDTVTDVIKKLSSRASVLKRDYERVESFEQSESNLTSLEHLWMIHTDDYIPEMTKYDRFIRETVIFFSDSKVSALVLKITASNDKNFESTHD